MSYLSGPVNNLADYQVEFNGFLMGPGTLYDVPPVWNFLDLAALKTMDQARTWADGSWSGPDFADVLLPSMSVEVKGSTAAIFTAAVVALQGAFAPNLSAVPLWVKLPGMPAMGIPAKTNKRNIPIDLTWNGNFSQASVQWRCPDPSWYSVPRTVTLAASGSASSGLVFPMFAPNVGAYTPPNAGADYGSTTVAASSATITNAGNSQAWPYVVVSGPCPGFTVKVDGNLVSYPQAIPAGQTVTVDYATGLATLTGNIDRSYSFTSRQFSSVPPAVAGVAGSSSVFFTATTGTATITVADVTR